MVIMGREAESISTERSGIDKKRAFSFPHPLRSNLVPPLCGLQIQSTRPTLQELAKMMHEMDDEKQKKMLTRRVLRKLDLHVLPPLALVRCALMFGLTELLTN